MSNVIDQKRALARRKEEFQRRFENQIDIFVKAGVIHTNRIAVLTQLRSGAALNMKALAKIVDLTTAGITFLVDDLEKRGLVERRTAPEDRRSFFVMLTEKGRGLFIFDVAKW